MVFKIFSGLSFMRIRYKCISRSKQPRWSIQLTAELARQYATVRGASIAFGDITKISPDQPEVEIDFKSAKDRTPTPVVSLRIICTTEFLHTIATELSFDTLRLTNYYLFILDTTLL